VGLTAIFALSTAGAGLSSHVSGGPEASWPLDGSAVDAAHTHNGTVSGATFTAYAAPLGGTQAAKFDGVDDEIVVPDDASLDFGPADEMTLSLWFRKTASPAIYHLLGKRNPVTREMNYQLARDAGGIHFNSQGGRVDTSVSDVPLGVWTHVAATYDGTTLRLYVNGTQASSKAVSGAIVTTTGALRIGGNTIWGEYFSGLIDEVRVYERALTATEIAADRDRAVVPGT